MAKARKKRGTSARVPKQDRSRLTRERILEAGAALFDRKGYDAATSIELAKEAGVAVGSLYAYFPDKRSILLEILEDYVRRIETTLEGAFLVPEAWRATEPSVVIRTAAQVVFEYVQQLPGLQREVLFRAATDADIARVLARVEGRLTEALRQLISALGQQLGDRMRPVDPKVASFVVYHSVEACCQHLLWQRRSKAEVEHFAAEVAAMVEHYLLRD